MNITFSGKYAVNHQTYGINFEAIVDGLHVDCLVSTDALQNIDPGSAHNTAVQQFLANQSSIEAIAKMKIRADSTSSVVITSSDIMINTYNETHIGHLPVRVLQHNIIAAFEGVNPVLLNYSKILIQNQNLDPEIGYTINKSSSDGLPIIGPHVKSKIYLDETFLAYVWCVCYVLFVETNNLINPKVEYDSKKSCKLFNYALRLKTEYVDWDKSVYINPEVYLPIDKDDIEKTNAIFQNAIAFILCHEFFHIERGHNKSDKNNELEADGKAVDLMFNGCNSANEHAVKYGITSALCVSIFLRNKLGSQTHPDSHDRIIKALDRLNIDENDICWAVACISLNVWQGQFNKVATWEDQGSFKETFIHVSQQLVKADTKP